MSTTYSVREGDTFALISRKAYGVESEAGRIKRSNPGVVEPLSVGALITIPTQTIAPKNETQQVDSSNDNEVAVKIDGKRFRFWSSVTIFQSLDTVSTVEFVAPFEFDNREFRELFKPFQYKDVQVTVGDQSLFLGTIIDVMPAVNAQSSVVTVNAYSLPGVLMDCPALPGSYPIEFNGQTLREIATTLADSYGLAVEFTADAGAVFETVALEAEKPIWQFLSELATQRNLVITSNPAGSLLFHQSVAPGNPVARLSSDVSPVMEVEPSFNAQEYYSHVTALAPVAVGNVGGEATVQNERLRGIIRPLVFKAKDTESAGLQQAASSRLGRIFGATASYNVTLNTWRNEFDLQSLWVPNTTVTLFAPRAMIYDDYEFIIRSVSLTRTKDSEVAVLNLVLPGSFSGEIPEVLPWDSLD